MTFAGTAFPLDGTCIAPGAVQQPRVPILVAGGGEKVTLRQVARFADVSNMGAGNLVGGAWSPEDLRRKHAVLDQHCAEDGRPPDAVLRTHISFNFTLRRDAPVAVNRYHDEAFDFAFDYFSGPPAAAVEYFQSLAVAGVQYFIVGVNEVEESLRLLAEDVMPALAG